MSKSIAAAGPDHYDISVIIPCRNEQDYITTTFERVTNQDGAGTDFSMEVLFVNGASEDKTEEVLKKLIGDRKGLRIIQNARRITPVAFNLGIRNAKGDYICIVGAHAEIADDYLRNCLVEIKKTNADNVGGPWRAKGIGKVGNAIAAAFQSPYSVGGAKGHNLEYEGYLDTVWGGFYKRTIFSRIGLFDEELIRNQDDELNLRLIRNGGKIWQSPRIRYVYICRNSIRLLFKQYYQYGYWKIRVIQKHKLPASIRHVVPAGFVGTLLILLGLSIFSSSAGHALVILLTLYALFITGASAVTAFKLKSLTSFPLLIPVFGSFHFGYGLGSIKGIVDFLILNKHRSSQITDADLTR